MFSPIRFVQAFAILASLIYLILNEPMEVHAALNPQQVAALEAASRSLQADLGALPAILAKNPNLNSLDSDDDEEEDDERFNGGQNSQLVDAQQTAREQVIVARPEAADLSGAASKYHHRRRHHHHHGHHAKGWLEMGAWSGKKGAFGWHDKHPVGKKGRK